jgi:hypothetical protein
MATIERAYADFRSTQQPSEKWVAFARMWQNLVVPPSVEVARLNGIDTTRVPDLVRGRVMAPVRISRVFVRDLGAPIYAAMIAHACFDMARCAVTAPFRSEQVKQDHAAFARKHGIDPVRFEAFKESIE